MSGTTLSSDGQNLGVAHLCAYFLVPPLGVYWRFGLGCHFFICLVLTLLFWLPGVIYAMFVLTIEDLNMGIAFLLATVVPPLGVWWRFGCGFDVLICTVLTLFFHLPGIVYAFAVLALKEDDKTVPDVRGERRCARRRGSRVLLECEDPEGGTPPRRAGSRQPQPWK